MAGLEIQAGLRWRDLDSFFCRIVDATLEDTMQISGSVCLKLHVLILQL